MTAAPIRANHGNGGLRPDQPGGGGAEHTGDRDRRPGAYRLPPQADDLAGETGDEGDDQPFGAADPALGDEPERQGAEDDAELLHGAIVIGKERGDDAPPFAGGEACRIASGERQPLRMQLLHRGNEDADHDERRRARRDARLDAGGCRPRPNRRPAAPRARAPHRQCGRRHRRHRLTRRMARSPRPSASSSVFMVLARSGSSSVSQTLSVRAKTRTPPSSATAPVQPATADAGGGMHPTLRAAGNAVQRHSKAGTSAGRSRPDSSAPACRAPAHRGGA